MVVTDLDVRPVVRISPNDTLVQVACVLAETRNDAVIVDTDPISEVTECDLVVALANGATGETQLMDIQRAPSQFVQTSTAAEEAATIMIAARRRSLIIVDGGRPVGIITFPDVASVLWRGTSWLGAFATALNIERRTPWS